MALACLDDAAHSQPKRLSHAPLYPPPVQTQKALPFIVGCPACRHNFVQLWCLLTCSPDQVRAQLPVTIAQPSSHQHTGPDRLKPPTVVPHPCASYCIGMSCSTHWRATGSCQLYLSVRPPPVAQS